MNIEHGTLICDSKKRRFITIFLLDFEFFTLPKSFQSDFLKEMIFSLPLQGAGGKNAKNLHFKQLNIFLLIILFFCISASAQDTGFPENWGRWKTRILLTAQNLGPNALPVPEIREGIVFEKPYISLSGFHHFSSIDKTYNPYFKLSLPIAKGKVAIEVSSAFYEYFQSDTISLIDRKAWVANPSGTSYGDIYVSTLIQLTKNHRILPDMMVSINLKTASGNNLEQLRHTDTPGYYFDFSLGKDFRISDSLTLRPYGLLGFYVYQTHQVMALQNDALLWGTGLKISNPVIIFSASFGGYYGYFNQGDRPVVLRISSKIKLGKRVWGTIDAQRGLNDFPYRSIGVGINTIIAPK